MPDINIVSKDKEDHAISILDHIGFPVLEFDTKGKLIYANNKAVIFLSENNLIAKKLEDIFPEHIALQLFSFLQNSDNEKQHTSNYFSSISDKIIHLKATPSGSSGIIVTINESVEKEIDNYSKIQQNLARNLKSLTESQLLGDIGSYDYDIATDSVTWTTNTYKIFGIPNGTPLSFQKAISAYQPTDAEKLISKSELAIKSGKGFEMDAIIHRKKDNREIYLFIRCEVQRDKKKNIIGLRGIVQDITERKRVEKEQQENRDLLQSIFSTSLIQISVLKAIKDKKGNIKDFKILIANQEVENASGRKDLIGIHYFKEYPYMKKLGLFDLMLSVMETGTPAQTEYNIPLNGLNKWYSAMFHKVDNSLVVTNLDITHRKESELERLRNLLLLQQTEEVAKIGSWEYNLITETLIWSQGMYHIYDKKESTTVNPEIYIKYVSEKHKRKIERIISQIKSGISISNETFEIKVREKNKTIQLKSIIVKDSIGKAISVLGVDMDITEIRKAEKKIVENAAMIKAIADVAPDMLYVIDMRKMSIIYANENVLQLFGKSLSEITNLGRAFFDLIIYPDDRLKFDDHIDSLFKAQDREIKELTFRIIDHLNHTRWVKTKRVVYRRDEDGKPTHVISVSQDITEQVNLQRKNKDLLHQQEELEKKRKQEIYDIALNAEEEERKRLADNLHNGLGQILYGVKLYLKKLDLAENQVFTSLHRTAYLKTNNLITEAIRESRRMSHELTPTVLEDFGLKAAVKDLCISFNEFISVKCIISGNPDSLDKKLELFVYRITQELLINILKHAGAEESKLKVAIYSKSIHIKVSDNGKGFDSEKTKTRGIGLRTIHNKVKMLGGVFIINSSKNTGTLIEIMLPISNY
jgi:PAS domain S-box-containing protein